MSEFMSYDPWAEITTRNGYAGDEMVAMLQKAIRRGKEEDALHAAYEMYITSPQFEEKLWRRLLCISVEDIGFGNPDAPNLVYTLFKMRQEFPYNDGDRPMFFVHAIRYLCRQKKERSSDHVKNLLNHEFEVGTKFEVPDAVRRQAHGALERTHRVFRAAAEDAVQRAVGVAKRIEGILQDQHIGAAAAAPHGGVARRGAAARGSTVAAVEMHPGRRHGDGLHIAPGAGCHSRVADGHALGIRNVLPHVEAHARVVLAGRSVAAFPDALERIADVNALTVTPPRKVPCLHGARRRPKRRAVG